MSYRFIENEIVNGEHMKHVHLRDDRPLIGTTTAINEVFPPPLAWWGSAMALEKFGWITEKKFRDLHEEELKGMSKEDAKSFVAHALEEIAAKGQDELRLFADMNVSEYRENLEGCYRNHDEYKKAKGKAGTDIHAGIELYIKGCIKKNEGQPDLVFYTDKILSSFVEWAKKDVERFLWSEAHTFSDKLWLGGITDFGFIHKNGQVIIGDNKPSIYPKHFIQNALYGIQIKENGLFNSDGSKIEWVYDIPSKHFSEFNVGYCVFDYNKGIARYRTDIERLESIGKIVVDLYKNKDVIGSLTL